MAGFSEHKVFGMTVRESADDGSDFSNPDADYRVLFLGEDGDLHLRDSAGSVTTPNAGGGGTGQGLVDFAHAKRTAGDVTCSANQVWDNFETGLDLVLSAASGDVVEVGLSVGASSTDNVHVYFTFVSVVSASPVNDVATGTTPSDSTLGVPAWQILASAVTKGGGSIMYTLQSGDISGGTVTLRLRYRTSADTNRVVAANTNRPVHVWAKNLGPAI